MKTATRRMPQSAKSQPTSRVTPAPNRTLEDAISKALSSCSIPCVYCILWLVCSRACRSFAAQKLLVGSYECLSGAADTPPWSAPLP